MKKTFRDFFDSDIGLLIIAFLITFFLWIYTGAKKVEERRKASGSVSVYSAEYFEDTGANV